MFFWALLSLAVGATAELHGGAGAWEAMLRQEIERLDDQDLGDTTPVYVQNRKLGTRSSTFVSIAISPTRPGSMYLVTSEGYVFSTHDGGLTWSEARLIVYRSRYFGAIRPMAPTTGAGVNIADVFQQSSGGHPFAHRPGDELEFPYGTTGEPYLEFSPDSPTFWPLYGTPNKIAGGLSFEDSAGSLGAGADTARLGVGLDVAAKRLGALLTKKGRSPGTMNLKLMLSQKGVEPTNFWHVAAHPTRADWAFAASEMGLFRTTDGGASWFHVFAGTNLAERSCIITAVHPDKPDMIFLGTSQGLRISRDGGENFGVVSGTVLSSAEILWIQFHQHNHDIIYVGTKTGAFRSDDGGLSWRWVFFETLDAQNEINTIVLHRDDPDRVILATADGLFRTLDGKKWKRSGGLLFTGELMTMCAGDPADGDHVICLTLRGAWESRDFGTTWTAHYLDDSEWFPRFVAFDPAEAGVYWIITSNEVLRASPKPPAAIEKARLAALRARVKTEPTLSDSMDAAFRRYGVHHGQHGKLRERASAAHILPMVSIFAGARDFDGRAFVDAIYLANIDRSPYSDGKVGVHALDGSESALSRGHLLGGSYVGVLFNWDLRGLVFDEEQMPFGRMFDVTNKYMSGIRFDLQRFYEERRRILIRLITQPPADMRSRLLLHLRLEELTVMLDALTGGMWADANAWVASIHPLSQDPTQDRRQER